MFGLTPSIAAAAFVRMTPMRQELRSLARFGQAAQISCRLGTSVPLQEDRRARRRALSPSRRRGPAARRAAARRLRRCTRKRMPNSSAGRDDGDVRVRRVGGRVDDAGPSGSPAPAASASAGTSNSERWRLTASRLVGRRAAPRRARHRADRTASRRRHERSFGPGAASALARRAARPRPQPRRRGRGRRLVGLGAPQCPQNVFCGSGAAARRDEAKVRAHRPTERRRISAASSASVPISVLAGVGAAGRDWRASIMPMTSRCASPGLSDRMRAPVVRTRSSRGAAAEERDRQRAGRRAHAVGPARDVVVGHVRAGDDDGVRGERAEHLGQARDAADRQRQDARAGARAEQLERAHVERVGIEVVARRVADQDARGTRRRRARAAGARAASRWPSARRTPTARSRSPWRRAELAKDGSRTSSTERSTERSASAASIAPSARSSSNDVSAPTRTFVSALQRLARAGDRGGDREALLERVAQCRDLAVGVEAVLAGRALRLRIPEAAFPGAQRVRADVEQRGRLGGLQRAHGKEKQSAEPARLLQACAAIAQDLAQTCARTCRRRYHCSRTCPQLQER